MSVRALDRQSLTLELNLLWQGMLRKEVSESDDFFDLGGDSLAALRMMSQVQTTYRVELEAPAFFEEPNTRRLAGLIQAAAVGKSE